MFSRFLFSHVMWDCQQTTDDGTEARV